jgi:hypothetical protein
MKGNILYTAILAACALILGSCANDKTEGMGRGKLIVDMSFGATRAEVAAPDDVMIRIVRNDANAVVYKFTDVKDPRLEDLWLTSGEYTIIVEGGVSDTYSFEGPLYRGTEVFEITAGNQTEVSVVCTIQNALFTVTFENSVKEFFSEYGVTLFPVAGSSSDKMMFDDTDEVDTGGVVAKTAYVILGANQTSIDWSFEGTHSDIGAVSKSGTLNKLEAGKRYNLAIRFTPSKGELGLGFSITIDDATEDVAQNILLFQRPRIIPLGGWFFSDIHEQGERDEYEMSITASSNISSITLSGSLFGESGENILATGFSSKGVEVDKVNDAYYGLTFTYELFEEMSLDLNEVKITVVDIQGKVYAETFKINIGEVSGPTGRINTPARADIWATHVALSSGKISNYTGTTVVEFAYRANSTGEWTKVASSIGSGGTCSAQLTGLTSGTTYQATLFIDGKQMGAGITFTTETALILENGSFEGWQKPAKPWLVYAEGAGQYWDTGNHGSTTIGESVTTPNDDVRPGSTGSRSANLQSTFVSLFGIGKFAAGNLFYGVYAGTSGTNGKVDFGQPFTSRPTALHGWYKVRPGTVTHASSGAPVSKGDPDQSQILVALTDWTGRHQVNTGDNSTFLNYDTDSGIIAYGDLVRTAGDGGAMEQWVEFTIPLTYRSTTRIPTYLVVSISSSRYGDYFTGSTDSWIRVDDFELIYD